MTPPDHLETLPKWERCRRSVAARHVAIRATCGVLTALDRLMGDRIRSGFGILMYHRCCPVFAGVQTPSMNVTPAQFERQMQGLLDRGFQIRSLPHVLDDLNAGRLIDRRTVVVTFDDGFAGIHENVLPVLKRLQIPASVFVCTQLIDSPEAMPFDPWGVKHARKVPPSAYRSVNSVECEELLDSGLVDIGAHTHSHQDFRGRPDDFYGDLITCLTKLEQRFGIAQPTFAYPYGTPSLGYADESLADAVRKAGLRCAVTSEARVNSLTEDIFRLGRLNVFPWDTGATLQARLHGWYTWLPAMSAVLKGRSRGREVDHAQREARSRTLVRPASADH